MSSPQATAAVLNPEAGDASLTRLGVAFLGFLASTMATSALMVLLSHI